MKNVFYILAGLFVTVGIMPVSAQEEESSAKLQTYSVGERRAVIEQEKIVMERPKFDTSFKMDIPKPTMGAMQIAKPNLEIVTGPASPQATANTPASPPEKSPSRTASAGTTANTGTPAGTGETRAVRPLKMDPPSYPRDALLRREEGYVIVEFTINNQGETEDISVVEAQPRGSFDSEARRAVGRWTFAPALRDGRPVSQRIRHTLEFKLEGN